MLEKIKSTLKSAFIMMLVTFIMFIFLEGLCSFLRVVKNLNSVVSERKHTQYDDEIGWVSVPNMELKDFYGKGKYLKTNAQGFRNNENVSKTVADGKIRVLCSGDSYVLGYGVSNDDTWCAQLENINKNIESVNMGQGGYSFGQTYLWYMRDGIRLDHQVQLYGFILNDFKRMQYHRFSYYDKPVLNLVDGSIKVSNYPIPKASYIMPRLSQNIAAVSQLNIVKAFKRIVGIKKNDKSFKPKLSVNETKAIVSAILDNLIQINRNKNSSFVLILFPSQTDYESDSVNPWRKTIVDMAHLKGIPIIDLYNDLKKISAEEIEGMFSQWHYNEKGSMWASRLIYERLSLISTIKPLLSQ